MEILDCYIFLRNIDFLFVFLAENSLFRPKLKTVSPEVGGSSNKSSALSSLPGLLTYTHSVWGLSRDMNRIHMKVGLYFF